MSTYLVCYDNDDADPRCSKLYELLKSKKSTRFLEGTWEVHCEDTSAETLAEECYEIFGDGIVVAHATNVVVRGI